VSEIKGFQKVFSIQSAKDSLKRMADGDLDSSVQFQERQFSGNSSEVTVPEQFRRASYSDSYS
jgi:hypothetical protein